MDEHFENKDQHSDDHISSPVVLRYIQLLREKREGFFDVEEFGSIIDHYVNLFDLKEASLAIEKGLLQHPRSFDISMRKAHLSLLSGNAEECLRILSSFELLHPNDEELMTMKAEAYAHRGDVDKAIRILEDLVRRNTAQDKARFYMQLAELYSKKTNILETIASWQSAIAHDPEIDIAYVELRLAYIQAEIPEEGLRYFKGLIDNDPYLFPAWLETGELYLHLEQLSDAIHAFEIALAIEDDHMIALAGKGAALFQEDRYEAALETFQTMNKLIGEDPTILCSIGECYEQMEEFLKADQHFLKALSIEPSHPEARLGHAIVCEHLGDAQKALKQMETVVGLEPDNAEYWFIYAELLCRHDLQEKGQLCFERAIQLSEKKAEYVLGQVDALIRGAELSTALDKVQTAFELLGDIPEIYFRGIKVLRELDQISECLVLLELLLERHGSKEGLRAYYPDIFGDSEAEQLLKVDNRI